MAFYEVRFPANVHMHDSGGAGWSTRLVPFDNGAEFRAGYWNTQRGRWTVRRELLTPTGWAAILALHRVANGRLHGFRLQDPTDYTDEQAGVVVQDVDGSWLLAKFYTLTSIVTGTQWVDYRVINKPQPGTIVTNDGSTVDYTTGRLTGATGATTWTGQFDVPVRFGNDQLSFGWDNQGLTGGIVGARDLELIEIIPPGGSPATTTNRLLTGAGNPIQTGAGTYIDTGV